MKKPLAIASLALISAMAATPAFAADEFNTAPGLTAAGAVFAFRDAGTVTSSGFLVALGLIALLGALLFGGVGPMRSSRGTPE